MSSCYLILCLGVKFLINYISYHVTVIYWNMTFQTHTLSLSVWSIPVRCLVIFDFYSHLSFALPIRCVLDCAPSHSFRPSSILFLCRPLSISPSSFPIETSCSGLPLLETCHTDLDCCDLNFAIISLLFPSLT